ncbi:flagellin [Lentilitoribacter sp. EG35]|uniref:flagellin N-terminal helical domain-containing protein n=1 Tax=Lentilitoribacter sp. EG35 TaxID=3234192 RepID=UPI00345F2605
MTSILTNNSASAALQTLRSINNDLESTQGRISSGYRVETAKDNSAYWAIATTMRSDNKALSTVQDALGLGAAKVDIAYTGMESSIEVVSEIKAKLVAAREPGVDKEKINNELTELKNQLQSISESASFSGENWLSHSDTAAAAASKQIVGSFNRASDGSVSLTKLDVDVTKTVLINTADGQAGILTAAYAGTAPSGTAAAAAADNWVLVAATTVAGGTAGTGTEITLAATTSDADVEEMIAVVSHIYDKMTDAASNLGAVNKRIEMQTNFVGNLMDSIDKGVGKLVDADMNEESTRLKALQTQQQLGIQALSIANSAPQNVISLFR